MTDTPHEHTKERILDEALRLFARDGYEAVSVSEIAGALHITASSVYRRMSKAEQLLKAKLEGWDFCG